MRRCSLTLTCAVVASGVTLAAQQMPDRSFRPMIEDRAYAVGTGPSVCVRQGHDSLLTLSDSFSPFGDVVRRDGYVARAVTTKLDRQLLATCRILVIAIAQPGGAESNTVRTPAMEVDEVEAIHDWVASGGSLLLVGNHMPAAASRLAPAFGVAFTEQVAAGISVFRSVDRTLRPHAIVRGRHAKESVARVSTFKGQAFHASATAEALLVLSDDSVHGAAIRVESGRAAIFGDATLFTAQIVGSERRLVGMNAPGEQNVQFVLNVMHWLSGVI